jgi:hypothetical protein
MRSLIIAFIFVALLFKDASAHPLHVSIVNMDVNKDSGSINYSIRLFYDDFQALINSKYNTMLDFNKEKRISIREQQYILDYLNSSFIIADSIESQFKPVFLEWKIENLSIWFYFGMKFTDYIRKFNVENTIMNDLFTDQKNLLIINNENKEQGIEFNLRKTKQEVLLY